MRRTQRKRSTSGLVDKEDSMAACELQMLLWDVQCPRKIMEVKQSTSLETLCEGSPTPLATYVACLQTRGAKTGCHFIGTHLR